MMDPDNKKGLLIAIMAKAKKAKMGDDVEQEDDSEETELSELHAIAEEIISAVKKEDASELAEALHSFVVCSNKEEADEADYKEEEKEEY